MSKTEMPSIRFYGFDNDWEQRKFSEITFLSGEKNRENLPLESYSITNESGFVPQDEKFGNGGTMREADKRMYYIVSPNSFAYNPARINVGSIGYQNTGKNVIVSSLYEIFKTSDDVDDRLLWHWFKSPDFQKLIWQLQEGGVRLYFYYDKLCMGEVSLPSLEEQRKIGKFFDTLDNLITLHQRKFEKLTNVKKSMLKKMFPQNGSSYPEIRFKGFTDPWEQRKLGEIASKYEDPVPTPHDGYYRLGIRSHAKGTFHSYVAKGQELETAQMHRVAAGNFIVNITFGWEHAVAITDENDAGKLVSHRFPQFSFAEGMVPEFFRYVIVDEKFRHHLWLASPGGAGRNRVLKLDDMLNYLMRFPSRDEQIKIAEFFRQLDHLITLHQRELEKLQSIKKALLEKMFV